MPKRKQFPQSQVKFNTLSPSKKIKVEPHNNCPQVPKEIQFCALPSKWGEPKATTRLDRGPPYIGPKPFEEYLYAIGEEFRPAWRKFFLLNFDIIDKNYDRIALQQFQVHRKRPCPFNQHPEPRYITPEEYEIAFTEVPSVLPIVLFEHIFDL